MSDYVRRVWGVAVVVFVAALAIATVLLLGTPSSAPAHSYSTPSYQQR